MQSWQGKSKGTPLGYKIFVHILKTLGITHAYFVLRFVSIHYYFVSFKTSRYSYHFFRKKLQYGKLKSLWSVYQNYYLFGQSIIDKIVMMSGIPNKFTFNFDGEQNLHDIVAKKNGGLLLSAHIGNWEIAGHLLKRINTKINVVMYDGEHEKIKNYLATITGKRQLNVIVIKNDLSHIFAIDQALKNNELVCMHADRFLPGNKTISPLFLGEEAQFPCGPFILAAKFKVPVSFVFAFKETSKHYHLYASQPKDYSAFAKTALMNEILKDYVAAIEKKVEQYPLQWFNYYDFWVK